VVEHQARKYGTTKFGLDRFVNGFLDLITLAVVSRFGRRPMHFFGTLGALLFVLSLIALALLGGFKLWKLRNGDNPGLVADDPWFFIFLTMLILSVQMFATGFIAELVLRNSTRKTNYTITDTVNLEEANV
jgi:hypothetical protein